jgi:hypothetical protein
MQTTSRNGGRTTLGALVLALSLGCTGSSGSTTSSSTSGSTTGGSGTTGSTGGTTGTNGSTGANGVAQLGGDFAFPVVSALGYVTAYPDGGIHTAGAVLLDHGDSCSRGTTPLARPYHGLKVEVATLFRQDNLAPNTPYVLGDQVSGVASANIFDSDGGARHAGTGYLNVAVGGTVTYTAYDTTSVTGTLDMQIELGDGGTGTLTGTFTAPVCP